MPLHQIDLNLLVALDALLRERSVTRAGARVGLSQPAMSSALARLRRLFGDELLVRAGREYHLTLVAQELVAPVHQIITLVEQTLDRRPAFDPATDQRDFSIAASDYALFLLLRPLLERLEREAPGVTLQFHPFRASAPEMVEQEMFDLVIQPHRPEFGLPAQVLFHDRWVCAVSADHPEVGDTLTVEQYRALPHLAYSAVTARRAGLGDQQVDALHLNRHVVATTESFLLLPYLLHGTRMVTLVHERMGERVRESAGIKLLEPPMPLHGIAEAIYWHPRRTVDPAHQWLRRLLGDVAADL